MKWPWKRKPESMGLTVDRSSDQRANLEEAFKSYERWLELYAKHRGPDRAQMTPEERQELVELTEIADKYRSNE